MILIIRNLEIRIFSDKMAIEFQYYGQANLLSKINIARSGIKTLVGNDRYRCL